MELKIKRYEKTLEEVWKEYLRPMVFLAKREPKIEVISNERGNFDFKKWLEEVSKNIKEILRNIRVRREPVNYRRLFLKNFKH